MKTAAAMIKSKLRCLLRKKNPKVSGWTVFIYLFIYLFTVGTM